MKVEELERYGKTLTTIPKESMKPQKAIMFRTLRRKFGLLGLLPFFVRVEIGDVAEIRTFLGGCADGTQA